MRSPILAAVLSLIVAGLGQIYNGQVTKGVIFIVIQLINGALTAVLIGWFLLPLVGLWAMIDAYMTAKHNNERYGLGASGNIPSMDQRDLLTLESAVTAIEEAASAVAREVERDRLREASLARLSTVEAELKQESSSAGEDHRGRELVSTSASQHFSLSALQLAAAQLVTWPAPYETAPGKHAAGRCLGGRVAEHVPS